MFKAGNWANECIAKQASAPAAPAVPAAPLQPVRALTRTGKPAAYLPPTREALAAASAASSQVMPYVSSFRQLFNRRMGRPATSAGDFDTLMGSLMDASPRARQDIFKASPGAAAPVNYLAGIRQSSPKLHGYLMNMLRNSFLGVSAAPQSRPGLNIKEASLQAEADAARQAPDPARDADLGIPDRTDYGDLSRLPVGDPITYSVQTHSALRSGTHSDLRIGTPELGMYSWAVPKQLPLPGTRHLAIPQALHSHDYASFEGDIPKGRYGAGRVELADYGSAIITRYDPNGRLDFITAHRRQPERYSLIKTRAGPRGHPRWLLVNTTPTSTEAADKHRKPPYAVVDPAKAEQFFDPRYVVSPKIDGARMIAELLPDRIEMTSYRRGAGNKSISHTHKFEGSLGLRMPRGYSGARLVGEMYATDEAGRATTPQALSGILNSSTAKAVADQRSRKLQLRLALFDLDRAANGAELPKAYSERLDLLRRMTDAITARNAKLKGRIDVIPYTRDPAAMRRLYDTIRAGRYPLTSEGIVATPAEGGRPAKIKFGREHNVYIRGIFPANNKGTPRAGGFEYSLTPGGPVAGRTGTGFGHDILIDMLGDPDKYIGRSARVNALGQFDSGSLKAPSFISLND